MEFIPYNKIDPRQWDEFCAKSRSAWFRHTSSWLFFCSSLNQSNENVSFGVFDGGEMAAVVPLIKQPIPQRIGQFEFFTAGTPVAFPAVRDGFSGEAKSKLLQSVFRRIDELAGQSSVVYSRFFIDPLSPGYLTNVPSKNPLADFGFADISMTTNIVDLSLPEDILFRNIRKGFRYDIRQISAHKFSVDFFNRDNITDEIFRQYKDIYFSAAGKEVGNEDRWKLTFGFIKDGNGILALEKDEAGRYVSGILVFTYKDGAYYAFGATDKNFKTRNGVSHLLQWEIMGHLKAGGFKYYELGWNFPKEILDEVYSSKELSISFFKSGFSGKALPLFRGEKFYDDEYMNSRKKLLAEKYQEQYIKNNG